MTHYPPACYVVSHWAALCVDPPTRHIPIARIELATVSLIARWFRWSGRLPPRDHLRDCFQNHFIARSTAALRYWPIPKTS